MEFTKIKKRDKKYINIKVIKIIEEKKVYGKEGMRWIQILISLIFGNDINNIRRK